ncbi:MAG: hypothetical protein XE07_0939, partial [Methanothrix harundinacea]
MKDFLHPMIGSDLKKVVIDGDRPVRLPKQYLEMVYDLSRHQVLELLLGPGQ